MKFTSFFAICILGAATAGSAWADDQMVLAPEPVELAEVCTAYGAGYVRLPGSETCLWLDGYVRTTYLHSGREIFAGHQVNGDSGIAGQAQNNSRWNYRARMNWRAYTPTEYGVLESYLRLQATGDGSDTDAGIEAKEAYIEFAGFRAGHGDEYWQRISRKGAGALAIYDGYYDDSRTTYFEYSHDFDNFIVTAGLEQRQGGTSLDSYNPYAGINYRTDEVDLGFAAVQDANYNDVAYKASAIFNFSDWQLGGWYAWEETGNGRYVNGNLYGKPGTHVLDAEWGVQFNGPLSDDLVLYGVYSQASGENQHASSVVDGNGFINWTVGTIWSPVKQLSVVVEYNEQRRDADLGAGAVYNDQTQNMSFRVVRYW